MDDEYKIEVHRFPMMDTGLGREAGYESDAAMLEDAERQRAALSPEQRRIADEVDRKFFDAVLFGSQDRG